MPQAHHLSLEGTVVAVATDRGTTSASRRGIRSFWWKAMVLIATPVPDRG